MNLFKESRKIIPEYENSGPIDKMIRGIKLKVEDLDSLPTRERKIPRNVRISMSFCLGHL